MNGAHFLLFEVAALLCMVLYLHSTRPAADDLDDQGEPAPPAA